MNRHLAKRIIDDETDRTGFSVRSSIDAVWKNLCESLRFDRTLSARPLVQYESSVLLQPLMPPASEYRTDIRPLNLSSNQLADVDLRQLKWSYLVTVNVVTTTKANPS